MAKRQRFGPLFLAVSLTASVGAGAQTPTPIASWHADEPVWNGATDQVKDSMSRAVHGTARHGATLESHSGKFTNATGCATCQHVDFDTVNLGIAGDDVLTVMAWVRWGGSPQSGSPWANILSNQHVNTLDVGQFWLHHSGDTTATRNEFFEWAVQTTEGTGGGRVYVYSTTKPQADVWYHLTGVYDGDARELRIYVNGVLEATTPLRRDIVAHSNNYELHMGQWAFNQGGSVGRRGFNGNIDEARIFKDVLTTAEIAAQMGIFGNRKPTAVDDVASVGIGSSNNVIDVLANDSTQPGGGATLSVLSVTGATRGTVTLVGGVVRYTPNAGYSGSDSFTYVLRDGLGNTDTGAVAVTVVDTIPPDTTIVSGPDAVIRTTTATFTFSSTEAGTFQCKLDNQNYASCSSPITYRYLSQAPHTFSVRARDLAGNEDPTPATSSWIVDVTNSNPVARNDSFTTNEDTVAMVDVLANDDSGPDFGETLSIASVRNGNRGSTAIVSGMVRYTPHANVSGADSFTYTLSDGRGRTRNATVYVTIVEVNDPPTAGNDTGLTNEEAFVDVSVLGNDTIAPDSGESSLTLLSVGPAANGVTAVNGARARYTPNLNFFGVDTFTYVVRDSRGATATATVTITVTDTNDPPTAVNDAVTMNEDTVLTLAVMANDSIFPDGSGETLALYSVAMSTGSLGTVTRNGSNAVYTPPANFHGTASFTYVIRDSRGGSAGATVSVTVLDVNDPPTAANDTASINEDAVLMLNVVANDGMAPDTGETLALQSVGTAANGTTSISGGLARYAPNANFSGTDTFTYVMNDGRGGTASARVNVTIAEVNDPPTATNDAVTMLEDTFVTVNVTGNDSISPDTGETLSLQSVGTTPSGVTTITAPYARFTPHANFVGTATFTYVVRDSRGGTATGTVTVTVVDVNDPPTAVNDTATIAEDTVLLLDVVANDSFAPDLLETLSLQSVGTATIGTVTVSNGRARYTPPAHYSGTASFTYVVSDGRGGTATASVLVTITEVNDPPTATNDAATILEDAVLTLSVLANDSFAPDTGETLTLASVGAAANGTTAISGTSVVYTPRASFSGTDSFTYVVSDGRGGTATGTVTVTVTEVNDAPTATNDAVTINEDTVLTLAVLANDSFAPDVGETLSLQSVGAAAHGTTTVVGLLARYTPAANFSGTDSFTYVVSDGRGGTATGAVTVTVTEVNDPPTAANDVATMLEDGVLTIHVLANDSASPDTGETLSLASVGAAANGTTLRSGTSVVYTPGAGFGGTDTFTYVVSDGRGGTATGTVVVTITEVNDPPTAVNDIATILEDTVLNLAVLANDSFAPDSGETLSLASVSGALHGTTAVVGAIARYTPAAHFSGTDSFTYVVSDGRGGTATGTVTVTITEVNDPPTATNDAATTEEDTLVVVDVLANDAFAPDVGETLSIQSVSAAAHGAVVVSGGLVRYTPNANHSGADTFTYVVTDNRGGTAAGSVTIAVTEVNDPPTATVDTLTMSARGVAMVNVLANDSISPDVGETLSLQSVSAAAHGATSIVSGAVRYAPHATFYGVDTFTYVLADSRGATATATVSITVEPPGEELLVATDTGHGVVAFDAADGAACAPKASGAGVMFSEGFAYGPDGKLYVASAGTDEVVRYFPDGELDIVFIEGSRLREPVDLVFGSDDNLYVANRLTHEVLVFDGTTGEYLTPFVEVRDGWLLVPEAITFGPDGHLYVASAATDQILRFNGDHGLFMDVFVEENDGGLSYPHELVFGPNGNLFVSSYDTNAVLEYDGTTGAFLADFVAPGAGGLNSPIGLAFGFTGELFVASQGTNAVLRYDVTGSHVGTVATFATPPSNIAIVERTE